MANELNIEKFIEGVRARPPLWNKVDPMHRNADVTNELWNGILDEMGGNLSVAELKQKWHNLRDCFRREVRIAQTGRRKRRWFYYNQMLFLLTPEFLDQKFKKNNLQQLMVQDEGLFPLKIEAADDITESDLNNTDSNHSEHTETDGIQTDEPTRGEKRNDTGVLAFTEESTEYCRVFTEKENSRTRSGESRKLFRPAIDNDDYHFAMSIIPYMRQVPMHRKLKMRMRISEIIAEESGYSETLS